MAYWGPVKREQPTSAEGKVPLVPAAAAATALPTVRGEPTERENVIPSQPRSVAVGELLVDRYLLRSTLAAGGSGLVFHAHDQASNTEVAVKVFSGTGPMERFSREGGLLARLQHPAIVNYVDHGITAHGERYVVTQLLHGPTLKQVLRNGPLSQKQTVQLAVRTLQALAVAHQAGIIHRDIKPENLIIVDSDFTKTTVIDFGIARSIFTQSSTRTGQWVGTPMYMAPEQARGEPDIDGRADVFALGCVLVECLIGRPHFVGDSAFAIMAKICVDDYTPLATLCPHVNNALRECLQSWLQKDRRQRPHDAAALAAHLESLLPVLPAALKTQPTAPPRQGIGDVELRVRALILVSPPASASGGATIAHGWDQETTESARARLGPLARGIHPLLNGAMALTVPGEAPMDQAVQAARCALAVRAALPDRAVAIALSQFEEAAAGGSQARHAADVTTNLLDQTQAGHIRLDDVTAKLLLGRFDIAEIQIDEGVIYELQAERMSLEPPRTVLGKALTFVGRQREMENLQAIYKECVGESTARAVLVTAPAGGGKSRVRFELMERLAQHEAKATTKATTLIARADPMHASAPLHLMTAMLRAHAQIGGQGSLNDNQHLVRQHFGKNLNASNLDENQRDQILAFLGEMADVPFPDDHLPALRTARGNAHVMGDQMRLAWLDWLSATVAAAPTAIVLEDLHWADGPSINLISESLRSLANKPLFVIAFARPEIHQRFPLLWKGRSVEPLPLRGLPTHASEQLVAEALPVLNAEERRLLAERCDGNPFFLEELLRVAASGRYTMAALHSCPPSILGVVQSRFDSLGTTAKRLLRAASVYGEYFPQAGLSALVGDNGVGDVERWLDILMNEEIIYRESQAATGLQYSFRHALLRDAAYETLTDSDRVAAHNAAAAWLEQSDGCEPMVLVEHYECGQNPERAAFWCAEAAEQTVMSGDLPATIAIAERGKRHGPQGDSLARLLLTEGDARCWKGEYATAETLLTQAMELSNGKSKLNAAAVLIYALGNQGKLANVYALVEALEAPSLDREIAVWQTCMIRAAKYAIFVADRTRVEEFIERAEGLGVDSPQSRGELLVARGFLAASDGNLALAIHFAQESHEHFLAAGDLREAASARGAMACCLVDLGMTAEASALCLEIEHSARQLGIESLEAIVAKYRAQALLLQKRYDEAEALASQVAEKCLQYGFAQVVVEARAIQALACLGSGRFELAVRAAEAALETSGSNDALALLLALSVLSLTSLASGRTDKALTASTKAMTIVDRGIHLVGDEVLPYVASVKCLVSVGRMPEARATLHRGLTTLAAMAQKLESTPYLGSYLQGVPMNAELLQLADRLNIDLHTDELRVLLLQAFRV